MKYFSPFTLDLSERTLWRDDTRVPLTHKAFDVLAVLVGHAGHVVDREFLLASVWPDTHVHPDNVKVLIGEIRRALGDNPARPRYIRSLVKRGYTFIAPVVEATTELSGPTTPVFVGRETEMDRLLASLDAAAMAERQVVFITGDAGIGKTALAESFLRLAADRHAMRAAWTQCARMSGPSVPYYPFLDLLTRIARSADNESVTTILTRHAPSWIPHLGTLFDSGTRMSAGSQVGAAARMLREGVSALEAIAEDQTLVLWIEDLQWADPATIDVLVALGQRRDPARLLVLAAFRPADSSSPLSPLRRAQADLVSRGHATEIRLNPLGRDEVRRYLELQLGHTVSGQASTALHRRTDGNPLFLATAIDDLIRRGHVTEENGEWRLAVSADALDTAIPASLAGIVIRELGDLGGEERHVVEAASVVGAEFSLWLAARAADIEEMVIETVLEALARRRTLIRREGVIELANGVFSPLYRFTHGLYQEIVLENMPAQHRAESHARAGQALERLFAGRESEAAADLACHFHGSGDHMRAAKYLRVAAGNALKRYAPREAAALLHGALAHVSHLAQPERNDVELPLMLQLGHAQLVGGEVGLAVQTLTRAERRATDENRPDDRIRILLALIDAQTGLSREATLHHARQLQATAPFASDAVLATTSAIRAGVVELLLEGWSDEIADKCLDSWRELPRHVANEHRTLAIRLLFVHLTRSGYLTTWTAGRKLLPMALASGDVADCVYCYYLMSVAALNLGRWDDAEAMAADGRSLSERTGSTRWAATMTMVQAWIALERQLPAETTRLCREVRPLLEGSGWALVTQMAMLFAGAAALGEGRLADATRDLEGLRDWYARERLILDWLWEPHLHICLSELALHQRDLERATAEAVAAQQAANSMPDRSWRARANVMAALVAIERGAHDEAGQYLRQARRDVRGIDAPLVSWRIEAVTATLHERTAHPDSARRAREKLQRAWQRMHPAPAPDPKNNADSAQSGPHKPAN